MQSPISKIKLKNISVQESFSPDLVISSENNVKANDSSTVSMQKTNNQTYYSFMLTNANTQSVLVLNTSFYKGWKAKINGKYLPESSHIVVNGYANGWILPTQNRSNENVEVFFIYQNYFEFALLISILAIMFSSIFLIYEFYKTKHK